MDQNILAFAPEGLYEIEQNMIQLNFELLIEKSLVRRVYGNKISTVAHFTNMNQH